ncbi:hypothetical protein PINS_up023437 [Pythium insidiosum]|nr:hypothetical protein PINS_up023437 [Pythium insidiosum]
MMQDSVPKQYEMKIDVQATNLAVAIPQDVYDATSELISLRSDLAIQYTWKPISKRTDVASSSDLDIQSNLIVDATSIQVVIANACRQGCVRSSADAVQSLVQIVEPCKLHVEVSDLFAHAGQQQQIVSLKFSPIEVFASYDDYCIAMEVADSLSASVQRFNERCAKADVRADGATSGSASGMLSPKAFETTAVDDAVEIHRYFTCDVGEMSLTLINDCDGCDMGLLQLQTQRCNLFLNLTYPPPCTRPSAPGFSAPAITISGGGGIVTLVSYYNPDTRDWHPMCSEWSVDAAVQGSIFASSSDDGAVKGDSTGENELHLILTANHPLDLVVTHGLLEMIASAGGAWNRRSIGTTSRPSSPQASDRESPHSREEIERRRKAPCVIRNETGLDLVYWMNRQNESSEEVMLASGSMGDLHYAHDNGKGDGVVRKYASRDRDGGMRLSIRLAGTTYQPVRGIEFEQLGSRAFPLMDESGSLSHFTLNCCARLIDGRIVLSISSQIKIVSQLSMPIQLVVNDPAWSSPVEIGILYPHRESAIPVLASLGTELRVRPLADAMYSWSAPIPVQTRSEVELRVECTSHDARPGIFCVSMSIEESLRVVCFSEPLVLINKLPVEIDYQVKSSRNAGGGYSAPDEMTPHGETLAVGAKSGIWWTDQQHRPQFMISVRGCQPSRWLELLHSGSVKRGEVFSVMLSRVDGRPFKLLIQVVEHPGKALHVFLYAEIWFINRTGLDLVFGNDSECEAYLPPSFARTLVGNAQITAFSSSGESASSGPPSIRISMGTTAWSSRFTADPKRLSWQDECLTLRSQRPSNELGSNLLYEFGISADYATRHFGSISTLISVIPRYLVLNNSPFTILMLEDNTRDGQALSVNEAHHILAKGDVYALYWVTGARSRIRFSLIGDSQQFGWSERVSPDKLNTSTVKVPAVGTAGRAVHLHITVKQGSISQSSMVIMINEAPADDDSLHSDMETESQRVHAGWDVFTVHSQLAGFIVTLADKKNAVDARAENLFGLGGKSASNVEAMSENVARLTVSKIMMETTTTRFDVQSKLSVAGVRVEDLLPKSKNVTVLRPVSRTDSFASSRGSDLPLKSFLEVSYHEKVHPRYRWIERARIEVQDVRVTTSMRFVDRVDRLIKETVNHFESHSYSSSSSVAVDPSVDTNILDYFIPSNADDDTSMASITGQKVYIESCEIAPVRVVISFSREKGDVRDDPNAGFWLSNLKLKIENAYVTLDAFKLTHALATQEALVESLTTFYEKSVKGQALGLIESIQVTSLVTSAVSSGVTSLVSTLIGKTDPTLATSSQFQYQFLTNAQIMAKHARMLSDCRSSSEFMRQIKHLVYDWDSNHTGLEARGCVVVGIVNNSRHPLLVQPKLNDGAELRVLPDGRTRLASVLDSSRASVGGSSQWSSDRAMVAIGWGYTPTLLTSGDVYFTVGSNACNIFATRKTARLTANMGYTATFTHQEVQNWWAVHIVIIGDDLQGHTPTSQNLFGTAIESQQTSSSHGSTMSTADMAGRTASLSSRTGSLDDEYEVVFSMPSLGLIAKQSGRSVIVRECLRLPSGEPGPALATGQIVAGDTILTVNGVRVTNTTHFRDLVTAASRPTVLRFRRTGERFNSSAAFDLFGERSSVAAGDGSRATSVATDAGNYDLFGGGASNSASDDYDLFGSSRGSK